MKKTLLILLITLSLSATSPYQGVFAWASLGVDKEDTNTHLWILNRAIAIMERNQGEEVNEQEIQLLHRFKKHLDRGVHHADWRMGLNSHFTSGCHFYNPDTGKSFIPTKTAHHMATSFFHKAGKAYKKGKIKKAFYYLGVSIHFLEDMTQPMHAANLVSFRIPSYHTRFELFASTIQNKYAVTDNMGYWNFCEERDPGAWLHATAMDAKEDLDAVFNIRVRKWVFLSLILHGYKGRWQRHVDPHIGKRLTQAQRITAGYLHMWFKMYVTNE